MTLPLLCRRSSSRPRRRTTGQATRTTVLTFGILVVTCLTLVTFYDRLVWDHYTPCGATTTRTTTTTSSTTRSTATSTAAAATSTAAASASASALTQGYNYNYACPTPTGNEDEPAANYDKIRFDLRYEKEGAHTMESERFQTNFRNTVYDDWGQTYTAVKENMRPFKEQYLLPHIASHSTLYESAAGLGLNLFMTLELLAQRRPEVTNVTIFGNEYLQSSTDRAVQFLQKALPTELPVATQHRLGKYCQGDSTALDFVPSHHFDVVYTGYILPIGDPLHLGTTVKPGMDPFTVNRELYGQLCQAIKDNSTGTTTSTSTSSSSTSTRWQSQALLELAQRRQEDFFAAWTGEMIRIAKPGAPVLVESVSQPKCVTLGDWGGVPQSWWKTAIDRYNWPVDPESLAFMQDEVFEFGRYHVFMRKLFKTSA